MQRTPEPELMLDPAQARAYAEADFAAPNAAFVKALGALFPDLPHHLRALDLGCGPGDILLRLAAAHPGWELLGIDGSAAITDRAVADVQRTDAIVRALAMQPKAILFDEPTSALDPETITGVLDVMRELAREGTTMVVVTHEMGFAREVADRVVFMADGQIVEQGPPGTFFAAPQHERTRAFLSNIRSFGAADHA